MNSFVRELKNRRVYRVALGYASISLQIHVRARKR